MKKLILYFFTILLSCASLHGICQDRDTTNNRPGKQKPSFESLKDRIYFGGSMGLQFGTITLIDASPLVGYRVSEKFSVGVGATYIYLKDNYYDYSMDIYGGRVFARYFVLDNVFVHGEYEVLNGQWDFFSDRRFNVENLLGGAGLRQEIGTNAYINFMVLWNFNESIYSPYANPIIRGGITFGI